MSTRKQINVTREQVVALLDESKDARDEVMVQACLWTLEAFKPNPTFYEKAIGMVERAIAFCPPEEKS